MTNLGERVKRLERRRGKGEPSVMVVFHDDGYGGGPCDSQGRPVDLEAVQAALVENDGLLVIVEYGDGVPAEEPLEVAGKPEKGREATAAKVAQPTPIGVATVNWHSHKAEL